MSLDKNIVKRVAHLARVDIPDDRLEHLTHQLSTIAEWFEHLQEVDTTDIQPMTSIAHTPTRWREDLVNDGNLREQVLTNAPAAMDGFFTVPKVVE